MKIIFAFLSLSLFSVTLIKGQNNTSPKVLDLTEMAKSNATKSTTDIFELIDFIPLETNQKCLTKISHTVVTQNEIFMFSQDQGCILKFNRKGDFIKQIGKRGRGPGEFCCPLQEMIQYHNGNIYLFDITCKKIIKYSADGNDFQDISLQGDPSFLISNMLDENYFLLVNLYPFYNKKAPFYELATYNNKGELIHKFPLNPSSKNHKDSMFPFIFWYFNNSLYYKSTHCDTAFKILGPEKNRATYVFSPGKKRHKSKDILNQEVSPGAIVVISIFETNSYLIISYINNGNKKAIFNKRTGDFAQIQPSYTSPENRLEDCVFLWPQSFIRCESKVPGEYISYIEPIDLIGININSLNIKSELVKLELIKLQSTIDEKDNPIIVVMKEKNN